MGATSYSSSTLEHHVV